MKDMTLLAARFLIAQIFFVAGIGKIPGYAGTQAFMDAVGVPGTLLPLVIVLEIGGALAIVAGWQTRWAALTLAIFSIVAAVIFHADFGEQMQRIMFMKNWAIAGGLLLLAAHGPGKLSLDSRLGTRAHSA